MIDTLFLTVSKYSIEKIHKREPSCWPKDGAVVRLDVEVEPGAIQMPTLVQSVRVRDWRDGLSTAGLKIPVRFITEHDAVTVITEVLSQMHQTLERAGYSVTPPPGGALALTTGDGT
jgi:hypothetical protein